MNTQKLFLNVDNCVTAIPVVNTFFSSSVSEVIEVFYLKVPPLLHRL